MIDVILTVVLIGFPIYVLWNLQVSWTKKSAVIVAFAIRIMYQDPSYFDRGCADS